MPNNDIKNMYLTKKNAIVSHLKKFEDPSEDDMIKEHLFCLLTPQSNAKTCWEAIEIISSRNISQKDRIAEILRGRARFHNTKAKRLIEAKKNWTQTRKILDEKISALEMRNKLAKSINGYGLKEAGHFLRNIGRSNNEIAILDRHILRNLQKSGAFLDPESKISSPNKYLELEQQALEFANKIGIPIDHLDLLFWHVEHEEFFK